MESSTLSCSAVRGLRAPIQYTSFYHVQRGHLTLRRETLESWNLLGEFLDQQGRDHKPQGAQGLAMRWQRSGRGCRAAGPWRAAAGPAAHPPFRDPPKGTLPPRKIAARSLLSFLGLFCSPFLVSLAPPLSRVLLP